MSEEAIHNCQRLDHLESQIQTLIEGQQYIIQTLSKLTKTEGKQSNKLPPKISRKEKGIKSSTKDVSKLLHLPEALQRNLVIFTDDLSVNQTSIPDKLISTGCLGEDECATISSYHSEKDKVRSLIRKIRARGPQVIETFLDIVGEDHLHLKEEVYKTLDKIVSEADKQKPKCIICIMQLTVDLRDIGDYLFQEELISDDIHGYIYETESFHINKSLVWNDLIKGINNYDSPTDAIEILKKALNKNYSHIEEYLNAIPERSQLSCSCCKRRRVRQRQNRSDSFNLHSLTDESTTSERPSFSSSLRSMESFNQFDSIGKNDDRAGIQSPKTGITSKQLQEIKENYINVSNSSGYFEPQIDIEVPGNETEKDQSLQILNDSDESKNSTFINKSISRIQFLHSVSNESSTTICEGLSNDSTFDKDQVSTEVEQNRPLPDPSEPTRINDDTWKEILSEKNNTEDE